MRQNGLPLQEPQQVLENGRSLHERYQIVQRMGLLHHPYQIYLAKDQGRPSCPYCIVKYLPVSASESFNWRTAQRFLQEEATLLDTLGHHANIPSLLAFSNTANASFLVHEWMNGRSLAEIMSLQNAWSGAQVIKLLQQVLPTLAFVHQHGIIHRNLCAENLIQHQQGQIILTGFGGFFLNQSTIQAQQHGVPGYVAPEQAQGEPRFSSDLYALGMICIQTITGQHPVDLPLNQRTGEVDWQTNAPITNELAAIVNKLVSFHFINRYQSVKEVMQDLEQISHSAPIELENSWLSTSRPELRSHVPNVVTTLPTSAIAPSNLASSTSFSSHRFSPLELLPDQSLAAESDSRAQKPHAAMKGVGVGILMAGVLSTVLQNIPSTPEGVNASVPETPTNPDPAPDVPTDATLHHSRINERINPAPPPVPSSSVRQSPSNTVVAQTVPTSEQATTPAPQAAPASAQAQESPKAQKPDVQEKSIAQPAVQPTEPTVQTVSYQEPAQPQDHILANSCGSGLPSRIVALLGDKPIEQKIPLLRQMVATYQACGKYNVAISLQRNVIESEQLAYGAADPAVFDSWMYLGQLYQRSGERQQAADVYSVMVQQWRAVYGGGAENRAAADSVLAKIQAFEYSLRGTVTPIEQARPTLPADSSATALAPSPSAETVKLRHAKAFDDAPENTKAPSQSSKSVLESATAIAPATGHEGVTENLINLTGSSADSTTPDRSFNSATNYDISDAVQLNSIEPNTLVSTPTEPSISESNQTASTLAESTISDAHQRTTPETVITTDVTFDLDNSVPSSIQSSLPESEPATTPDIEVHHISTVGTQPQSLSNSNIY